jgi:hypothetical protein
MPPISIPKLTIPAVSSSVAPTIVQPDPPTRSVGGGLSFDINQSNTDVYMEIGAAVVLLELF